MRLGRLVSCLLSIALVAGCTGGGGAKYPDSYVLQAKDLPSGLKLSDAAEDLPITNPGRVPDAFIKQAAPMLGNVTPDEVWAEFVEPTSGDGGLAIFSGYWVDGAKYDSAIAFVKSQSKGQLCGDPAGAAFADTHVLLVIGGDDSMKTWVSKVISALHAKAPELHTIC